MKENVIILHNCEEFVKVKPEEITSVTCDTYVSTFRFKDKECKFTCAKTLKEIEKKLPAKEFIRISRNTIINLRFLRKINYKEHVAILEDGTKHSISVRRLSNTLSLWKNSDF